MSPEVENTPCASCGKTFSEALEAGSDWIFHWGSALSTTLEAETCSDECSSKYEKEMGR